MAAQIATQLIAILGRRNTLAYLSAPVCVVVGSVLRMIELAVGIFCQVYSKQTVIVAPNGWLMAELGKSHTGEQACLVAGRKLLFGMCFDLPQCGYARVTLNNMIHGMLLSGLAGSLATVWRVACDQMKG